MLTIKQLDVRFEIEGSDDEASFARLFRKHMRAWKRLQTEEEQRLDAERCDRLLGDREEPKP
jgi:hypothetical protein